MNEDLILPDTPCIDWINESPGVAIAPRRYARLHRKLLECKLGRGLDISEWSLHVCDNRKCVNPFHLYAGTPKDNAKDREIRNRNNYLTGENHQNCKVSDETIREIRRLYGQGWGPTAIAKHLSLKVKYVGKVVRGRVRARVGFSEEDKANIRG